MRKLIYNLEFPSWCPSITVYGYKFFRMGDYKEKILQLQHLVTIHSEFSIKENTGQHAITAYVELPEHEVKPSLEWKNNDATALNDILLLLSIFTGRDVFEVDETENPIGIIVADPRQYYWGGSLRTSIPYKEQDEQDSSDELWEPPYDIGFEEGLNQIYSLIRTDEWQKKYKHGYFLFLAKQAFRRQILESSFTQCWTIWEHLFAIHNRSWLSDEKIYRIESVEKIAFILTEYALRGEVNAASRKRIESLARIRNRLVHYGKLPEEGSVYEDTVLFIRMTEFVIAKILGLSPSNIFNTVEGLEAFFKAKNT